MKSVPASCGPVVCDGKFLVFSNYINALIRSTKTVFPETMLQGAFHLSLTSMPPAIVESKPFLATGPEYTGRDLH